MSDDQRQREERAREAAERLYVELPGVSSWGVKQVGLTLDLIIHALLDFTTAELATIKAERDAALAALQTIERWREFPAVTTRGGLPSTYGIEYGSNGERDYMRLIAREVLARAGIAPAEESLMLLVPRLSPNPPAESKAPAREVER